MAENPQDHPILICGAGGRLGRLLRRAAVREGAEDVLFQARRPLPDPTGPKPEIGAEIIWTPGESMAALPRASMVVALWGVTAGSAAELDANARLVPQGDAVARACGADRLLHISSAGVYGPGRDLDEATPLAPVTPYGHAKLAMERAVEALQAKGGEGPQHGILRLANVIGADSLAPGLRGDSPIILDRFGDGCGPLRSYVSATDLLHVIRCLSDISQVDFPAVLNVASLSPVAMEALARAAGRVVTWAEAPESAVQEVTLSTRHLHRLLPGLRLRETPEEMIADWHALEAVA